MKKINVSWGKKKIDFLNYTYYYIGELEENKSIRIIFSKRSVKFLGFVDCIKSAINPCEKLVLRQD